MSTNLYVAPADPVEEKVLPKALKFIISRHFLGHDGSLVDTQGSILDRNSLGFLEGIRAASTDKEVLSGVADLIDLIWTWGRVKLTAK